MLLCLLCPQLHYAICFLATYSLGGDCAYTPACLCAPTYDVYRVACVKGCMCAACKSLHCMHLMSPVLHLGLLHHTLQCLPAIDGDAWLHVYLHQMLLSCTCTAATTFVICGKLIRLLRSLGDCPCVCNHSVEERCRWLLASAQRCEPQISHSIIDLRHSPERLSRVYF